MVTKANAKAKAREEAEVKTASETEEVDRPLSENKGGESDLGAGTIDTRIKAGREQRVQEVIAIEEATKPIAERGEGLTDAERGDKPPSYYQPGAIPLTPEEAAASEPLKHITGKQLSKEETEDESEEEEEVVKGHITTDEERLDLLLKQPKYDGSKVRRGAQAPLQMANKVAEEGYNIEADRREAVVKAVDSTLKGRV